MRLCLPGLFAALALVSAVQAADIRPEDRLSGFDMMGAEAQAMQRDDFANPAMLGVREGEALWSAAPAPGRPACAACHGPAPAGMKGVAARYPARERTSGHAITLSQQIRSCQSEKQAVPPSGYETAPLLALEAYVALQSRGLPIEPPRSRSLDEAVARGEQLYNRRMGQLDLSCAHCHSQNWGKMLGGTRIPQGHPTGYPIFRMEWQALGSLQRRLRNCLTGIRAEPFAFGAPEMADLEAYLMQRAAGMPMDAPGVRP